MRRTVFTLIALAFSPTALADCVFTGSPSTYVRCIYDETVALWSAHDDLAEDVDRIDAVGDLCSRVFFTDETWTYVDLAVELNDDNSGHSVCGETHHVCNADEANVYGIIGGCDGAASWLVGGFSNTEFHRRSVWNGQDSTQCDEGRFPMWYGSFHGYKGRVHCTDETDLHVVACCLDM